MCIFLFAIRWQRLLYTAQRLMFSYTYFGLHANKMYDLPKVCCACLSQTNNLKHVNNSASVDEELLSIFNYFMIDLNWSKSKYNVYICSECYLRLQEAYQFLKMCHQNNTTLQGYVATLGHSCNDLEGKHSVMFVNAATIKCEINENVQLAGELKDDSVKYPTYNTNIASSYSHHHTSKMVQDDSKKPHRCMICNKGFNRRTYLDEHMRLHTGEKPFKCTECDKCFIRKTNLLQHKRVHTGKKPYKCIECEKCFIDRAKLVTHQRIHAGDKPFACSKCSKCFIDRSNLIKHERTHTGEKPFVCTVCSKCFSDRSSCARHKRSHETSIGAAAAVSGTFVEPHKCMMCSQYFLDRTKLETHLRIHNGEKPYGCSVCNICFSVKSDLTAHLRIHTG